MSRSAAVDTSLEEAATYELALRFAKGKEKHGRRAGSLSLPAVPWEWPKPAGACLGQLRSVYVRLTIGGQVLRPGSVAGRPTWTPIGVWCEACQAFWPKPR